MGHDVPSWDKEVIGLVGQTFSHTAYVGGATGSARRGYRSRGPSPCVPGLVRS